MAPPLGNQERQVSRLNASYIQVANYGTSITGRPTSGWSPTALSRAQIGGRMRFAVGFIAKVLSRIRAAAHPRAVGRPLAHLAATTEPAGGRERGMLWLSP